MHIIFRWMAVILLTLATASPAHSEPLEIAAIVNEDMVSSLDVEQRIQLALATTGLSDTPEVRARMRSQIVRTLVDERLQMQEAKRLGVSVTDEEVEGAMLKIDAQRQLQPGAFENFLVSRGVPLDTVKDQLRAQIAWSKVIMQSMRSRVRVSEDEITRERENLAAGKDITEYHISSIVLAVDKPEDEPSVKALAEKLSAEIKDGANFLALANQFSAGGADIVGENQYRWVQLHQLEPVLAKQINRLNTGEVTPPVRTLSGYHLIKLHDSRTVNTSQVLDSEMLLKQITMRLKPTAPHQEAQVLLDIAREIAKYPGTCQEKQVAGVSELDDLEFSVHFQRASFRQLQPQLQEMLVNLRVGDTSEPYATPEGIHLVQLCERVEMPVKLPPSEAVRDKLYQDKLALEAAKRLRDLRREALVEVRE